jgi:hypothetical protein
MDRMIIAAALMLLAATSAFAQTQTFDDVRCPVTFAYPSDWNANVVDAAQAPSPLRTRDVVCRISFRRGGMRASPFTIVVANASLRDVVKRQALGRVAKPLRTSCCSGVQATVTGNGGYREAILNDRKRRSAVIHCVVACDAMDGIVQSFSFR